MGFERLLLFLVFCRQLLGLLLMPLFELLGFRGVRVLLRELLVFVILLLLKLEPFLVLPHGEVVLLLLVLLVACRVSRVGRSRVLDRR